jgi:hypothetical protein
VAIGQRFYQSRLVNDWPAGDVDHDCPGGQQP